MLTRVIAKNGNEVVFDFTATNLELKLFDNQIVVMQVSSCTNKIIAVFPNSCAVTCLPEVKMEVVKDLPSISGDKCGLSNALR